MAESLRASERATTGLRRVLRSQLLSARGRLAGARTGDAAVHELRRDLKRARSTLRLLRPALDRQVWRREDAVLGSAAGAWGTTRDSTVLVAQLDKFEARAGDRRCLTLLATLRHEFEREVTSAPRADAARRCATLLTRSLHRIGRWRLPPADWSVLGSGLRRVYRAGRRGLRAAEAGHHAEDFHAWRRDVKYLRYQLELLAPLRPARIGRQAAACHRLSDLLGEEHDLAVLRTRVASSAAAAEQTDAATRLTKRIDARRRRLQRQALALGNRVYAKRAAVFTEALHTEFRAWRRTGTVRRGQASVTSGRPDSTT